MLTAPDGSQGAFVFVREAGAIAVHDVDGTLLPTAEPSLR